MILRHPAGDTVSHVLSMRARSEMVGAYTGRVVATVKAVEPAKWLPRVKLVRKAMCEHKFASDPDNAVAVRLPWALPFPTASRRRHVLPEVRGRGSLGLLGPATLGAESAVSTLDYVGSGKELPAAQDAYPREFQAAHD